MGRDGRDAYEKGREARLLRAACGYWGRRGLRTGPEQVVYAPGVPLLFLVLLAVADPSGGGVLLTRPSAAWHEPPVRMLGRRVYRVPVPADCGGVPDPIVLLETVGRARAAGDGPRVLLLSVADDPTGTSCPPDVLHEVCEAAGDLGLLLVSDERGRDFAHEGHATMIVSPAEITGAEDAEHEDRVVVLTGAGTTRPGPDDHRADGRTADGDLAVGLARFPGTPRGRTLADEARTVLAALRSRLPPDAAETAAASLEEPAAVRQRRASTVRTDGVLAAALHDTVTRAGGLCLPPHVGRQVYADLEPARHRLARHGIEDAAGLEAELVRRLGSGAAGGHRYGDDPRCLRVRLSTHLLTGPDDPLAPDPLRAPHVRHALAVLGSTLAALTA